MNAIENIVEAQKYAMKIRPKVGGFPVLAAVLKKFGVLKNVWYLPSCQSIYFTENGNVVFQGNPLVSNFADIPFFDKDSLIFALTKDKNGEGSFDEFLNSSWKAGVVKYEVDFLQRKVIYYGILGEEYIETYSEIVDFY